MSINNTHIKPIQTFFTEIISANEIAEKEINNVLTGSNDSLEKAKSAIEKRNILINAASEIFSQATKQKNLKKSEAQTLGTLQQVFRASTPEHKKIDISFQKAVVEVEIRKKAAEAKKNMESILDHLKNDNIEQIDQDLILSSRVPLVNDYGNPYEKYDKTLAEEIAAELKTQLTSSLENYNKIKQELKSEGALSITKINKLEKKLAAEKVKIKELINLAARLEKNREGCLSIYEFRFSALEIQANGLNVLTQETEKADNALIDNAKAKAAAAQKAQQKEELVQEAVSVSVEEQERDDVVPELPKGFVYEAPVFQVAAKKKSFWQSFKNTFSSFFCFLKPKRK